MHADHADKLEAAQKTLNRIIEMNYKHPPASAGWHTVKVAREFLDKIDSTPDFKGKADPLTEHLWSHICTPLVASSPEPCKCGEAWGKCKCQPAIDCTK